MILQIKLALWLASVLAVFALFYGAYHYGRHVQSLEDSTTLDKAVQAQLVANQAALLDYTNKLQTAGVQHDTDQTTIDNLHSAAGRLRIHIPTCPVPGNTTADVSSDGSAGLLPNTVDESFARLQDGVSELTKRCDQLNIDAIRINAEVK